VRLLLGQKARAADDEGEERRKRLSDGAAVDDQPLAS
jgi:hypothetical protein